MTHELGPLPEPDGPHSKSWDEQGRAVYEFFYTADQMRAYALAEVARAVDAERAKHAGLLEAVSHLVSCADACLAQENGRTIAPDCALMDDCRAAIRECAR